MAKMSARKPPPEIPALEDDPEYREALELDRSLSRKRHELAARLQIIDVETALSRHRNGGLDPDRVEVLERQLSALRASVPEFSNQLQATSRLPEKHAPAIAAGLDIVHGNPLEPVTTNSERRAELRREIRILDEALAVHQPILEEIRSRKAYELALQLRDAHNAMVVAAYRAAQAFARETALIHDVARRTIAAGYGLPRTDILRLPASAIASSIGLETDWGSGISRFRRALEEAKLI